MAITSDGTQAFGIEASPVTINAVVYILEGMSFNKSASRADINDSNGEPLGSVITPGRIEGSGTIQLATSSTVLPSPGDSMVLSGGRNDGTYLVQDIGETQSQGDYVKASVNFYKKVN